MNELNKVVPIRPEVVNSPPLQSSVGESIPASMGYELIAMAERARNERDAALSRLAAVQAENRTLRAQRARLVSLTHKWEQHADALLIWGCSLEEEIDRAFAAIMRSRGRAAAL